MRLAFFSVTLSSHRPGDKVKIKPHPDRCQAGDRAVVVKVAFGKVVLRLQATSTLVALAPEHITNFSLAARKAWQNMPHRQVGRPKGSRVCDRVSVTLRLNRDLWEMFRAAEEQGLIADRTKTINAWISDRLQKVVAPKSRKIS